MVGSNGGVSTAAAMLSPFGESMFCFLREDLELGNSKSEAISSFDKLMMSGTICPLVVSPSNHERALISSQA